MKVLLTGAFGNVGSSTLDELLERGLERGLELPRDLRLADHLGVVTGRHVGRVLEDVVPGLDVGPVRHLRKPQHGLRGGE